MKQDCRTRKMTQGRRESQYPGASPNWLLLWIIGLFLLGSSEVVHTPLLMLVHLTNGRRENVFTSFYLPFVKGCIWFYLSALIG